MKSKMDFSCSSIQQRACDEALALFPQLSSLAALKRGNLFFIFLSHPQGYVVERMLQSFETNRKKGRE